MRTVVVWGTLLPDVTCLSTLNSCSGNAAYNASKAAVKSLTEGLAAELRERPHSNVTAHLFMWVSSCLL